MIALAEACRILRGNSQELRDRFGLTGIAVFGSVARNEAREGSDLDLLGEFDHPVSLLDLAAVENHLIDLLGIDNVDLIPKNHIRPQLRDEILREAIPV
jgi:predicted nucleotidyltransferase